MATLLSAVAWAGVPIFPDAGTAPWRAQALTHGNNATWITHTLAPDRQTFFLY